MSRISKYGDYPQYQERLRAKYEDKKKMKDYLDKLQEKILEQPDPVSRWLTSKGNTSYQEKNINTRNPFGGKSKKRKIKSYKLKNKKNKSKKYKR